MKTDSTGTQKRRFPIWLLLTVLLFFFLAYVIYRAVRPDYLEDYDDEAASADEDQDAPDIVREC